MVSASLDWVRGRHEREIGPYAPGMPDTAIEIRGLKKNYGSLQAVRGIDLTVDIGEVFALLGPNGAGKTTTVEILEGHRIRTEGEVSVLGFDPGRNERRFKERIGIVLQETGVERFLTVAEVIELYRSYYPHPLPLDEVIEVVGLGEKRDTRVNKLSGGQQRRLDVAVGLSGNPELLFLDEPTTGFDPSARRNAWDMIRNLRSLGKTVFLTTHYMDEAQSLADRVAIIAGGLIVAEGPPATLVGADEQIVRITFKMAPSAPPLPHRWDIPENTGDVITLTSTDPVTDLHELTGWAMANDVELAGLKVERPSLEEVYLELTLERGSEQ
jgi:ABC-2 type transport system ATP-binding protein